jgi:hypothetical protein
MIPIGLGVAYQAERFHSALLFYLFKVTKIRLANGMLS